ncbi:MAG: bifunctional riboflavin kinase/FAD synthetase [Ignavibacteria bacterium]|jgi:riboflavin kinase/FMN adenylyltransferase|nr:bifunctional riboflavin kinase/FAD synthetase [Ignavibacteria bacterium]MDH7527703.1 bifunctional riboflavin kinase/FAD synthetase [Ignavibacteria bacterium]
MNVYYDINEIKKDKNTILTVGTFDGVHLGHQKIINEMIYQSVENNCRNLVITFDPHPQIVLSKENSIRILTTLDEKLEYLNYLVVQNVLVINFTKEFSQLDFRTFVEDYLVNKIGLHTVVVGTDHHFGKNREGNPEILTELGRAFDFNVVKVEPLILDGQKISSTRIRKALMNGNVKFANEMLGKKYVLKGKVVKGNQRGATIGFPTANIEVNSKDKLIPARGVYFVEVDLVEKSFYGMMNIGYRPTFNNTSELMLEVHIFYFDGNIYDEPITIRFIERLRDEKKFNTIEELKSQLQFDKQECFKRIDELHSIK